MTMGAEWLSPAQVAQALSLSLSTVRAMLRDHRLPARRLRGSRLLRISRVDLEALLEPVDNRDGTKTKPPAVNGRREG